MVLNCDLCGCSFTQTGSLNRHKKNVHANNKVKYLYDCSECQKQLRSRPSFLKHWRSNHASTLESKIIRQRCPLCKSMVKCISSHFVNEHDLKIEKSEHTFTDENLFYGWKKQVEINTRSKFILRRTKKNRSIRVYVCHRSSACISKSTKRRGIRRRCSKKIDGICPASMKFYQTDNGMICVKFKRTHVGHDCEDDLCDLNVSLFVESSASTSADNEKLDTSINADPLQNTLITADEDSSQNEKKILVPERNPRFGTCSLKDLKMNFSRLLKKVEYNDGARSFLWELIKDSERKVDMFLQLVQDDS